MPQRSSDRHFEEVSRQIEELKASTYLEGNIKVVVNSLTTSVNDYFAIDTLFQYVNKNVVIKKKPDIYAQSGLQIGVGGDNFKAQLNITREQLKSSEISELFLVLADGSSGYINIGTKIAVPRFYHYGRWYSHVSYEFRQAGRSMEVFARKLPSGLIEMELTPVFSRFLNDGGDLVLTELSTRVTVRPGQTLVIGGGDTSQENVATALLSYSKTGETKKTLMTVTCFVL